ncbi:MAG: DNA translocase FtsK 4TM domain-containing protein [Bacillota bacterium]
MLSGILKPGERKKEIAGILIAAWGIFSGVALYGGAAGIAGSLIADFYRFFVGNSATVIPVVLVIIGYKLIFEEDYNYKSKVPGFIIAFISFITIYHIVQDYENIFTSGLIGDGGGLIGGSLAYGFKMIFGATGAQLILTAFGLIGILLFFDIYLTDLYRMIKARIIETFRQILSINYFGKLKNLIGLLINFIKSPLTLFRKIKNRNKINNRSINENESTEIQIREEENLKAVNDGHNALPEFEPFSKKNGTKAKSKSSKNEIEKNYFPDWKDDYNDFEVFSVEDNQAGNQKESKNIEDFKNPHSRLLKKSSVDRDQVEDKSKLLEKTLNNFGVDASVINVTHGPTITRYEIQPEVGVKVSKVVNLSNDIALSLAAHDVRIEAPIPGKSAIGIEVPHQGPSMVRFREIVESDKFASTDSRLNLGLGRAVDGSAVVADLGKMPHLLVAGATGSGKSVCINSIIASLLYQNTPDQLKLLLVDPKKVELVNYKGLPHLFSPVVTDCKKAASTLQLIVKEMEDRYDLFAETGTRGIESYNKKSDDPLPYIVVIIDELSDLMMVAASDVEDAICRLAQMSRAAGIHLVIATQRPSVDVITGLIKANIPSRISFAVSSGTDSRTILDTGGAEKLLGNGDMLFHPVGAKKPFRVQGAFIDNEEINNLVNYLSNQVEPDFYIDEDEFEDLELNLDDEEDELLEDAIRLVVEYRASISMLQRRLHIGHSRAARLIDNMEEMGIVGPYVGSKPREVLITEDELEEYLED